MSRSSAGGLYAISLFRMVESADITPEPDEDERAAILAALTADDVAMHPAPSCWAEALLPARDGEDGAPYPE
jgi:hypothetical protein